jgi:membrane-associated phospholipid phosphatase
MKRPVEIIALAAACSVTLLGTRYAGVAGEGPFEARVDARVRQLGAPHLGALRQFVDYAGPPFVISASVGLALTALALRRPRLAWVALSGPALTGLATSTLQSAIGRTLNGGPALPSGHTAGITAVACVAGLIVLSVARARLWVASLLATLGVLAAASTMSFALVASRLHFLTDTIAGIGTALAVVLGTAVGFDALGRRRAHR